MAQVSVTVPQHVDEFLESLSIELGVSKSSLVATMIEIGVPIFANSINERYKCLDVLGKMRKEREKKHTPKTGKNVSIEYVAEVAAD